jgi:hypothetical protein
MGIDGGGLDSVGSGWSPVAGFCGHGDEPSRSVGRADYCLTG